MNLFQLAQLKYERQARGSALDSLGNLVGQQRMGGYDELRLLVSDKGAKAIPEQQRQHFMHTQRGRLIIAVAVLKPPQFEKVPAGEGIVAMEDTGIRIHDVGFVVLTESIL